MNHSSILAISPCGSAVAPVWAMLQLQEIVRCWGSPQSKRTFVPLPWSMPQHLQYFTSAMCQRKSTLIDASGSDPRKEIRIQHTPMSPSWAQSAPLSLCSNPVTYSIPFTGSAGHLLLHWHTWEYSGLPAGFQDCQKVLYDVFCGSQFWQNTPVLPVTRTGLSE